MVRPVIIIGAGGHTKVLIATLVLLRREIIGVMEANHEKQGGFLSAIPIIGDDQAIKNYKPEKIELVNGIGSVGSPHKRMEIYQRFKKQGYKFAGVVHPSAIVMSDVQFGEGVQIMAGAIIQPGVRIGDNAIINTGAILDHDCIIGEHTHIAPGAVLSGGVHIGVASHVGTSATIIQGIRIGGNSIIGAGAVVIKNIPADNKAAGVPARNIKK
jgi:sugar O-acyltransferase (sialic acid O-acetyltransferase NeuD family)